MTLASDNAAPSFAVKATLLLVVTLPMMAFAPLSPSLPAIYAEFASVPYIDYLSRFVLTLPAVFIALFAPVAGVIADRFGRKRLLFASVAVYGASGIAGFFVESLTALLVSRAILGIAIGGLMTAATAYVGDYYAGTARQSFLGLRGAFVNFAAVGFNLVGGFIAIVNWRLAFLVFVFAFFLLPFISRSLHDKSPGRGTMGGAAMSGAAAPKADRIPVFFVSLALFLTAAYAMAFFLVPVQMAFYLRELGNADPAVAGLMIATSALAVAVASLFYTRARARMGAEAVMALAFALAGLGYFFVGTADSVSQVFVAVVVSGCGYGLLMANIVVWILDGTPAAIRGRVSGGIATATFIGHFLSPLFSQPIVNAFGVGATYLAASAGLVAIALGFFVFVVVRRAAP